MEYEVTQSQDLLDKNGQLMSEGWARRPLWRYRRQSVTSSPLRLREWEHYTFVSYRHRLALSTTFSDMGRAAYFAIAFVDYEAKTVQQVHARQLLSLHRTGLSENFDDYTVSWANKELRLAFSKRKQTRRLLLGSPVLDLNADVSIEQPADQQSISIASTWAHRPKAFFLNEKINCLRTRGILHVGNQRYEMEEGESFATLNWGKRSGPYRKKGYWASASGLVDHICIGLHLNYSLDSQARFSENAIVYNGVIHKLGFAEFSIPTTYTQKWHFKTADKRLDILFEPAVNTPTAMSTGGAKTEQKQLFGSFKGTVILDDGTKVEIDELLGFAEVIYSLF
ncbi:MAG: DUF2804 domain-containing protein [Sphaerochaetaceae bacterium]|jgi:hypothetical protein